MTDQKPTTKKKQTAPKSKTVKLVPPSGLGDDAAVGTTLPGGKQYTVKVSDAPIEVTIDSPEHCVLIDLGWSAS